MRTHIEGLASTRSSAPTRPGRRSTSRRARSRGPGHVAFMCLSRAAADPPAGAHHASLELPRGDGVVPLGANPCRVPAGAHEPGVVEVAHHHAAPWRLRRENAAHRAAWSLRSTSSGQCSQVPSLTLWRVRVAHRRAVLGERRTSATAWTACGCSRVGVASAHAVTSAMRFCGRTMSRSVSISIVSPFEGRSRGRRRLAEHPAAADLDVHAGEVEQRGEVLGGLEDVQAVVRRPARSSRPLIAPLGVRVARRRRSAPRRGRPRCRRAAAGQRPLTSRASSRTSRVSTSLASRCPTMRVRPLLRSPSGSPLLTIDTHVATAARRAPPGMSCQSRSIIHCGIAASGTSSGWFSQL